MQYKNRNKMNMYENVSTSRSENSTRTFFLLIEKAYIIYYSYILYMYLELLINSLDCDLFIY